MTHDEMIAVIQAHKEGKTIQFRVKNSNSLWLDAVLPHFNFAAKEYRIKPEPKVIYVNEYGDEVNYAWCVHITADNACKYAIDKCTRKAVKYIEVIE